MSRYGQSVLNRGRSQKASFHCRGNETMPSDSDPDSGCVERPLKLADIELPAAHENVHDALRLRRVAAAHEPAERGRDDLPREAVFVLQPSALPGLAAIGRELRPVGVELRLR